MTGPRPVPGDRIHVEFDGYVQSLTADGLLRINDGHPGDVVDSVHPRHCTVIVPPIVVGDLLSEANFTSCPHLTLACADGHASVIVFDAVNGAWDYASGGRAKLGVIGARVLRIGGAS